MSIKLDSLYSCIHVLMIGCLKKNKLESNIRFNCGFTLLELLVSVSLTVIILMVAGSVLVSFMISSVRNKNTRNIKNEGEYAINQIARNIQNAIKLEPNIDDELCELNMQSIAVRGLDGGITEYAVINDPDDGVNKIASNSALLTSDSFQILDLDPDNGHEQYIAFDCVTNPEGDGNYISIRFGLGKGEEGLDRAYEISKEFFTTGVSLRNY